MEPMKPMKPMEPMKPMAPMTPMEGGERWWPEGLGSPSSSGAQDGMRYAFFPKERRLAVETDGKTVLYDSGPHRISGVAQANGGSATFTDADGTVSLSDFRTVG